MTQEFMRIGAAFAAVPVIFRDTDGELLAVLFRDQGSAQTFCDEHSLPNPINITIDDVRDDVLPFLRRLGSAGARYVALDGTSARTPIEEVISRNER